MAVRYGTGEVSHLGYTNDFGGVGLFIQGNTLYPPGTELQLSIIHPDGSRSTRRGIVRWIKDIPRAFRRSLRGGMGIELIHE
jgi:hypothetical protein